SLPFFALAPRSLPRVRLWNGNQLARTLKIERDGIGAQTVPNSDCAVDVIGNDAIHTSGNVVAERTDLVDRPRVDIAPLFVRLEEQTVVDRPVLEHDSISAGGRKVADVKADYERRGSIRIQKGDIFNQLAIQ